MSLRPEQYAVGWFYSPRSSAEAFALPYLLRHSPAEIARCCRQCIDPMESVYDLQVGSPV
jgi:hypothetical protein